MTTNQKCDAVRDSERDRAVRGRERVKCNLLAVSLSFQFDVTPLQYLSAVLSSHDRSIISKERSCGIPNGCLLLAVSSRLAATLSQTSVTEWVLLWVPDHSLGRCYANAESIWTSTQSVRRFDQCVIISDHRHKKLGFQVQGCTLLYYSHRLRSIISLCLKVSIESDVFTWKLGMDVKME